MTAPPQRDDLRTVRFVIRSRCPARSNGFRFGGICRTSFDV
jgi:hypothetical protein